jgi:hypothetical protein
MYDKTEWKARKGSNLNRFKKSQETPGSVILENEPTAVTEPGTPFSVDNMNKIEQGVYDAHEIGAAAKNAGNINSGTLAEARLPNLATTAGNAATGATQLAAGTNAVKTILQRLIDNIAKAFSDISTKATAGDLTAATARITAVEGKIPNQAGASNQLADKDFVNSSVNAMAAHQLTYNAAGGPFPTKAALNSAAAFYYKGAAFAPTEHDYCVVTADESQGGAQVRYVYNGAQWIFSYKINDKPFTSAQSAAIDSGATAAVINSVGGKADKASGAAAGNLAGLGAGGNLTDSGKKPGDFVQTAEKGAANGVATLGSNGQVPQTQIPSVPAVATKLQAADININPDTVENAVTYFNSANLPQAPENSTDWHHILTFKHNNYNGYFVQLALGFHSDKMFFRKKAGGVLGDWRQIQFTDDSLELGKIAVTAETNTSTLPSTNNISLRSWLSRIRANVSYLLSLSNTDVMNGVIWGKAICSEVLTNPVLNQTTGIIVYQGKFYAISGVQISTWALMNQITILPGTWKIISILPYNNQYILDVKRVA